MDRVAGDVALLREIFELFRADWPRLRDELGSAILQADAQRIERAAHATKSPLGTLGGQLAFAQASRIEQNAVEGELSTLTADQAELEAAVDELIHTYREEEDDHANSDSGR